MNAVAHTPLYGRASPRFVAFLHELGEVAPVSAKKYVAALAIDLQELSDQGRVHRNTLSRVPTSKSVQDYLRQARRVIKAAVDLKWGRL